MRYLLLSVGLLLIFLSLYRFGYWFWFKDSNNPVPFNELITAFYLGIKFDLRLILLMFLPLFLLGWIKPFNPFNNFIARYFWLNYMLLAFGLITLVYFIDYAHFAYLHKPLDASALRFLVDFSISANMIWQSYPVTWLLIGLFLLIFIYHVAQARITAYCNTLSHPYYKWWQGLLIGFLAFFIYLSGMYGKFSYYPLRWSDAFASTHAFAPAVAVNPVVHFFDTLKNKNISYDEKTARHYYPVIADYLGIKNGTPFNYTRHIDKPGPFAKQQPNIVMVFLESFASYKTGAFSNPLDPTPHFDKLADNGILFTRYYSPTTGTARSVFCAITGLPDVERNKTSSRNPLIVDQHTIVNAFKDYNKFYFLGGSANWGNIRGVLSHNIPGLKIHEEGDYTSERVDVWGISDLSLFEEADKVFKQQKKPFFAILQTSGNHRPYTIPENNHNFAYKKIAEKDLKPNGFASEEEFNAFRFMDHSIGHFMDLAKQSGYLNNTIFVFYGDHGISGFGGNHTPEFETRFELTGLHVPLVFYAPGLITPSSQPKSQQYDIIASEVDLLPSIAGLAATSYTNTTMGRNLFNPEFDAQRYAFIAPDVGRSEYGLVGQRFLFFTNNVSGQHRLYDTSITNASENVITKFPDVAKKMQALTDGILETTRYMLYHNKSASAKHQVRE